jgi:transcriptional regulator with XRE-family HTH domain
LRANLGNYSYNVRVTTDELWRRVGRVLMDERLKRRQNWTEAGAKAGVDPKTIQSIEQGEPGNVEKLAAHATAFGMSIVDVIASVLKATEEQPSREAVTLLRIFETLTEPDRTVLLVSARRALEQHEARAQLERRVAELSTSPSSTTGPHPKGEQKE